MNNFELEESANERVAEQEQSFEILPMHAPQCGRISIRGYISRDELCEMWDSMFLPDQVIQEGECRDVE